MAALNAASVTYVVALPVRKNEASERVTRVDMSFGDGASTYPAGGVPVTRASLGCPNVLSSLAIVGEPDSGGFVYKHDNVNKTIRVFEQDGSTGALTELTTAATPAAITLRVVATGW